MTAFRRLPLLAALALAAALAGCARTPATPLARSLRPFPRSAPALASRNASQAASALASASAESTPLVEIGPAGYVGRPLLRAPFATSKVAITIDDGPSRKTAEVLSIFERYGVRSTFFYVGNRVPRYRRLVARASREGFEIGNHTWDHQELKAEPLAFDLAEIDRGEAELQAVTGRRPVFVRPPSGHFDGVGARAASQRGLVLAMWSVHGRDTGRGTHAEEIARGVIANTRGGDIILLHETNAETVRALPSIIEGLRRKGFEPVTLSELLRR